MVRTLNFLFYVNHLHIKHTLFLRYTGYTFIIYAIDTYARQRPAG